MSGRRDIIYWDTCIWLAWFGNETNRKAGEMDGVQEDVRRFETGETTIVTSVITWTEMFKAEHLLGARAKQLITRLFNRPSVVKISADLGICRLASDIRSHYVAQGAKDGLPTVDFGDAIHLASAITYGASAFHTFDETDRTGSGRKAHRGLLGLNGNVAGHRLLIQKPPQPAQPSLRLVMPSRGSASDETPAAAKPKE
jgi:predicted nucleic acid-binding protein